MIHGTTWQKNYSLRRAEHHNDTCHLTDTIMCVPYILVIPTIFNIMNNMKYYLVRRNVHGKRQKKERGLGGTNMAYLLCLYL